MCRLERSTKSFPLIFRYLENRGLQGELWSKCIATVAMMMYIILAQLLWR